MNDLNNKQMNGERYKRRNWYEKECNNCGTIIDRRNLFCPACSHTLEDVTRKHHIDDNKSGISYLIRYFVTTFLIICLGLLSILFFSVSVYLFGKLGYCFSIGFITFVWVYLIFNVIKPIVKEVKHANRYIKDIRIK